MIVAMLSVHFLSKNKCVSQGSLPWLDKLLMIHKSILKSEIAFKLMNYSSSFCSITQNTD